MTLPAAGNPMSLNQVLAEAGIATANGNMASLYGKLGAPGSGPLDLASFHGKSAALNVSANPTSLSTGKRGGTITTGSTTVSAAGGNGSYTFSWGGSDGDPITCNSPNSASTSFSGQPGPGNSYLGTFICTVTDSTGAVGTASVTVSLTDTTPT